MDEQVQLKPVAVPISGWTSPGPLSPGQGFLETHQELEDHDAIAHAPLHVANNDGAAFERHLPHIEAELTQLLQTRTAVEVEWRKDAILMTKLVGSLGHVDNSDNSDTSDNSEKQPESNVRENAVERNAVLWPTYTAHVGPFANAMTASDMARAPISSNSCETLLLPNLIVHANLVVEQRRIATHSELSHASIMSQKAWDASFQQALSKIASGKINTGDVNVADSYGR